MTLSPRVSNPPPPSGPTGGSAQRRKPSPFAGMNRTDPGQIVVHTKKRLVEKPKHVSGKRARTRAGKTRIERQPGDMKALKMQRALSHVPYQQRTQIKTRLDGIDSFEDFPLLPLLQEAIPTQALKGLVDISPTPVQSLAIPAILGVGDKKGRRTLPQAPRKGMQQFLLAAETGTGKTLAYALPVIDAIKRQEMEEKEEEDRIKALKQQHQKSNPFELESPPLSSEQFSDEGRPRAIILVPTAELVDQVGAVFKSLSHTVKLRVAMISASYSSTVIRNRLFSPTGVDVVISTPHLLGNIAESTPNVVSRVSHLVIDEADSLFDRSFAPLTASVIDRAAPSLKQLILCSATITRSLDSYLQNRFPDLERLATPNLHAIPRRVQLAVVDIEADPYRGNRDLACADTIWSIGRSANEDEDSTNIKRLIVFVNEREKAKDLAAYLVTKGVDAAAMSRDTEQRQSDILAAYTSTTPTATVSNNKEISQAAMAATLSGRAVEKPAVSNRRILKNTKVLVMTDLGSRGIDTVAVRHVILYDVPHTTIDFIHRLGRTGRMGRRGRGIVLQGKNDRKDVIREVREGMFRGQALI